MMKYVTQPKGNMANGMQEPEMASDEKLHYAISPPKILNGCDIIWVLLLGARRQKLAKV